MSGYSIGLYGGLYWVYLGVIQGLHRGYLGII